MSYLILIDEDQRVALMAMLEAAKLTPTLPEGGPYPVQIEHPLEYWHSMLEALPHDNQMGVDPVTGQPRQQVNGFCL